MENQSPLIGTPVTCGEIGGRHRGVLFEPI